MATGLLPGLHILVDPDDSAGKGALPTSAEVDIVAVHGLNFRNNPNHARDTWTKGDKLWLRDFLPQRLPKSARVMLFAYNASPAMGSTAIKLDDHAKNLLHWLGSISPKRPIVFICHSLGGLVVKEALVEANLDSTYKVIVDATCLLVFFATPHQGGNYASFGELVANIARAGLRKPSNDLVAALKQNSDEAGRRFEQFRHQYEKCLIISFYEGQPYGKLSVIVDKKSATLNLPGTREKQIAMDAADHSAICKFASIEDPACLLAIETIAIELERALKLNVPRLENVATNLHWCIPRPVNKLFTGRTKVLEGIKDALDCKDTGKRQQQQRFVITGLGGQGKSELCLKIADLTRESFWGIFWVDVSTDSLANAGFLAILERLGSSSKCISDACQLLSNTEHKWLLILDNADDPNFDYGVYFPSGIRGTIMMTSRNHECSQYSTIGVEELTGLDEDDCVTLLLKAAEIHERSWLEYDLTAKEIVKELGSHTLALIQAGAYVAQDYCPIDQYLNLYRRQRERLLKFSRKQAQSRYCSVYATFEASAQILETLASEDARDALDLLKVLSMLHYDQVPMQLFEDAWVGCREALSTSEKKAGNIRYLSIQHVTLLPAFMPSGLDEWDSFRLQKAQNLLLSLALTKKGKGGSSLTISMHPLTHAWIKDRQDWVQKSRSWETTGSTLALSYYGQKVWRPYYTYLGPHLQSFLDAGNARIESSRRPMVVIQILFQCCWVLYLRRDDLRLQDLLQQIFHELGIDMKSPPTGELYLLHYLVSLNLSDLGQRKQALDLLQEVVAIENTVLAEDHPSRLASQHGLAIAYHANGQVEKAIQLLEHIVKVQEKSIAEDHPDQLASQHGLAIAYHANGQVEKAIQLLEHIVKVQEKSIAEDHPDQLASQHGLAIAYHANGQVEKAIQLLEHVVKVKERSQAEDHPSRLVSQYGLAIAYHTNGKAEKAIQLLEHIVKVEGKSLAEDHPDQLASQHGLAIAYHANGQVEKAIQLLEHIVKVQEKSIAEDHPDQLASQHGLAIAYHANGQVEKAIQLLEHVVKVKERSLAEDHPDRLVSQHGLAVAYHANGQADKAIQLLEHVLKVEGKILAEDDPSRLVSQRELARIYEANGQINGAMQVREHMPKALA